MPSVCFYFQVHQPRRLRRYRVFDIGERSDYWSDDSGTKLDNKFIIDKVSQKCYLPTNQALLEMLQKNPDFKIAYSFSGVFLDQLEEYAPDVLDSFKRLVDTGQIEVLSETYYHTLSFLRSPREFERQVRLHAKKIKKVFGVEPKVFRNTELIYHNDIAKMVSKMGYKGMLAEGADHVLDWRSPNFLYRPKTAKKMTLLLKNYQLSDDIAFRFGNKGWESYPLDAGKFADWVSAANGNGNVINLFMDYETFGEHQWEDTGIFEFLKALPDQVLQNPDNDFVTPSEAIERYDRVGDLDVPYYVSWADEERDLSAWYSNDIQKDAMDKCYELEKPVLASRDQQLIEDWRRLQTSDHFYYMCTKWFNDGDVHKYFSPYESPYEAFISYMNALKDVRMRLDAKGIRN